MKSNQAESSRAEPPRLVPFQSRKAGDAPFIPGSDGAGMIEETGEGVRDLAVHTEVIINPSIGWEYTDSVPQVPDILGGPSDGTFAEHVIVPAKHVLKSRRTFPGRKQASCLYPL
ncbi:alcohol dehydrogenase catalytic domain-containing protein [Bacillus licheniformis]|nr:alcohol dehydrogenase catalytic domain-containing protein [Bacillus licheniformis]